VAGARVPGPLCDSKLPGAVDDGTLARTPLVGPGPVAEATAGPSTPGTSAPKNPDIEALDLAETARTAAYALKKEHPTVTFTSGRRDKAEQARAMADNVALNRTWIEETYAKSKARDACQKWVNDNADKKTAADIEAGLLGVLNGLTDSELAQLSKHLSGEAFDVQPVTIDAGKIKTTIKGLPGVKKFLDTEGGLVRWHAQF
jgi:hypothetical protein